MAVCFLGDLSQMLELISTWSAFYQILSKLNNYHDEQANCRNFPPRTRPWRCGGRGTDRRLRRWMTEGRWAGQGSVLGRRIGHFLDPAQDITMQPGCRHPVAMAGAGQSIDVDAMHLAAICKAKAMGDHHLPHADLFSNLHLHHRRAGLGGDSDDFAIFQVQRQGILGVDGERTRSPALVPAWMAHLLNQWPFFPDVPAARTRVI